MDSQIVDCLAAEITVSGFGQECPAAYSELTPLPLRQSWLGPESMPQERAVAYPFRTQEGLAFYVWMQDTCIFTEARKHNEKMWQLGDVVEFFVKPGADRADYWEIHLTPNNLIMDIHIPSREGLLGGSIPWDQVIAADSGASTTVVCNPALTSWAAGICIPWKAFGSPLPPPSGTLWQAAVCRYNSPGTLEEEPELSSTALLQGRGFHRYEDYHLLRF